MARHQGREESSTKNNGWGKKKKAGGGKTKREEGKKGRGRSGQEKNPMPNHRVIQADHRDLGPACQKRNTVGKRKRKIKEVKREDQFGGEKGQNHTEVVLRNCLSERKRDIKHLRVGTTARKSAQQQKGRGLEKAS